jgi:hypothetical protein
MSTMADFSSGFGMQNAQYKLLSNVTESFSHHHKKLKRATHSIKRKQGKGAKQILKNQRVKRRY